jgi:hypothetical protein
METKRFICVHLCPFVAQAALSITALLVCGRAAQAAIFPDQIGWFKKSPVKTVAVPDQALYDEYGLDGTEQADYTYADKHFSATAWRMRDSTGAMALFESRRPPGAIPATPGLLARIPESKSAVAARLAVRTSDGVIFVYGNYVFRLTGTVPPAESLQPVYMGLPKLENSPLPVLMTDLPPDGLIPNSERYIVGPVSLSRFEPRIPPSVAAFHLGTEGQLGTYKTPKGAMTVTIFDYPTPSIARDRYQEFQKIPGAVARRVGDLVAVAIAPPDADAAEQVLSRVRYDTNITLNEKVPVNDVKQKVNFILDVFVFAGVMLLGCLVAGIAFGGYRTVRRKFRRGPDPESLTTLHL